MKLLSFLRGSALGCFLFSWGLLNAQAQFSVKLNEVAASNKVWTNSFGNTSDWIELYNTSASAVDLSDASLSDSTTNPRRWIFPPGTSIAGNGRLIVLFDADVAATTSPTTGQLNTGYSLSGNGDHVYFYPQGGGTAPLDSITFGLQISTHTLSRVPDGTGSWVLGNSTPNAANTAAVTGSVASLRVNEWVPNPSSGDDWFEVYNSNALPVVLSGVGLTDDATLPQKYTIPAYSFIGTGEDAYIRFWADNTPASGANHVNFKLNNTTESISIYSPALSLVNSITYNNPAPDGVYGRLPDGSQTIVALVPPGTPGAPNFLPFNGIVVNEVLSHTDPPIEDAVEFANITSSPISIGGWYLSNSETKPKKYRVPDGTVIPANGYYVFYESQFNGPSAAIPFTFNAAHGDQVYLSQADPSGNLTGYRVSELFEASEHGISIGRFGIASVPGDYKFVELTRMTFGPDGGIFGNGTGASNAYPRVGPIVISEIMYFPPPVAGTTNDNLLHEFVELQNITHTNVPLYDPQATTNHWRLQNALTYTFPDNSSIPAFSFALVVPFDPVTNTTALASFRQSYPNIPSNVQLFGPWVGKLGNAGDPVELYKPDPPQMPPHPDAGFVPYIRVDKVNYLPTAPWPTTAAGTGNSIQRRNPYLFGNDPVNWQANTPNPGTGVAAATIDTDSDGMPDEWELSNGLYPYSAIDASEDADNDGSTNLQEYLAGTNPQDPASVFKVITVIPAQGDIPQRIEFQAVAGRTYTVQVRNDLNAGSAWQKLSDVTASRFTRIVDVPDPDAATHSYRFYRVVTPATP